MGKDIERQLLWWKDSQVSQFEAGGEIHRWNILIINAKDKIDPIKRKLYEVLNPVIEEKVIRSKGDIINSDLFYELFSLISSLNHNIIFSKIYRGKVKRDARLYSRKSLHGWDDFIEKIYHRGI